MKRIVLMAAVSVGAFFTGCAPAETCSPFGASSATKCTNIQACCTSTQCRYTADGSKEWKCAGTTCTDAATKLATDCT